jgi:hypothetical protein
MLRQSVAESEAHRLLAAGLEAALEASTSITETLAQPTGEPSPARAAPPPAPVLDRLRQGLHQAALTGRAGDQSLELAELIRELSVRHGPDALRHALDVLRSLDRLLRRATGIEEGRS